MKLVIEDETGTRSVVPFTSDEITVGRAADGVTFRLADRDVSRRHARFLRSSGAVFVEDLGSLTGTRVNGERIAARRRLREGDLVEIGDYDLAVLPDVLSAGDRTGAPPPLPAAGPPRGPADEPPLTREPGALGEAPGRAARRGTVRRAVVAGAIALVLGIALGFAAGTVGIAPTPPPAAASAP